jgi:GPI mannosyltransferase 3
MSIPIRKLFVLCLITSALLFFISASKPLSYLHPDEYFQVVEFASYKMGITPAKNLAWEFNDKIRPGVQPFMCYHIFKTLAALGIQDHYVHLYILRLLTALLTLFAISIFCYSNLSSFSEKHQKWYILFTYFFWVPYFYGTRFASETWSGDCLLLATSLVMSLHTRIHENNTKWLWFTIGLFLGLAFLFRFQTVFFSASLFLWLIVVRKERYSFLFTLTLGALAVFAIGLLTDRWLYGDWVCSQWLYLDCNVFKGVANNFGTSPFYFYALLLLGFTSPPIGFLIFLSVAVLLIRQPKNLYLWVVLAFVCFHSMIAHKESRFMYPIYFFIPVLVMSAIRCITEQGLFVNLRNRGTKIAIGSLLVFFNLLFLVVLVLLSDYIGIDSKIFAKKIHKMAQLSPINIYYKDGNSDPFVVPKANTDKDLYPEYLRDKHVKDIKCQSYCQIESTPDNSINLIALSRDELITDTCRIDQLELVASTMPQWLIYAPVEEYLGKEIKKLVDMNTIMLYKLKK